MIRPTDLTVDDLAGASLHHDWWFDGSTATTTPFVRVWKDDQPVEMTFAEFRSLLVHVARREQRR